VDNAAFRILKAHTPGPYTFILKATREVPKRLLAPKRKYDWYACAEQPDCESIADGAWRAIDVGVSVFLTGNGFFSEAQQMAEMYGSRVDLVIDGGAIGIVPTTVIDLSTDFPKVIRQGKGETGFLA